MPSKLKVRRCFRNWQGIFSDGSNFDQNNPTASKSINTNRASRSKKSRHIISTQTQKKITGCFRNWQGIDPSDVKLQVPKHFQNWQGIYLGNVKFDKVQPSTIKYITEYGFVCSNKQENIGLRRCFRNWQGIYLGFMNFDEDEAVFFKDVLTNSDNIEQDIEKNLSSALRVEQDISKDSDIYPQAIEDTTINSEPNITITHKVEQHVTDSHHTIEQDTTTKPHLHQDMKQDTTTNHKSYHKIKHDIATNTEIDHRNQRHTKMNSYIPLKIEQDVTAIERHLESLQQEQKQSKKRQYTEELKAALVSLVLDKKFTISQVAYNADVPHSTLLNWVNIAREGRNTNQSILKQEHKQYLIDFVDENPTAVLNEAFDNLTQKFEGLNIKKTHIQEFMKTECNIKVLKTDVPNRREIKINLQNRIEWVNQWCCTDMDYMKNCVFIECPRLDVVMKSGGLPYKKSGINVTPRYFFVAVSAIGVVETCMFHPGIKREDPYVDFLNAILDKMDGFNELKGSYIVMNNMHNWLLDDLEKLVTDRGYKCVYMPPYCSDLNPITKFWTTVKYRINRHYLMDGETISHRINESRTNLSKDDLEAFIQHSKNYFIGHLNKPNA